MEIAGFTGILGQCALGEQDATNCFAPTAIWCERCGRTVKRPDLIAHADWGTNPNKRWMAVARVTADGNYTVEVSSRVGYTHRLLARLRQEVGPEGVVLVGFDFPIGLPATYAHRAGITDFLSVLPDLGTGKWDDFYHVAERSEQISIARPFYPQRPGGTEQAHLLKGLGVNAMDDLRRRCERAQPDRRAACSLFWTLGGQQVGKAAITGWREVIGPALRDRDDVTVWPFAGSLEDLLQLGRTVIVETYPAEVYGHIGITFGTSRPGQRSGKRVQADRRANAERMLAWGEDAGVEFEPGAVAEIGDGFGTGADGEDRFDAVVGLLGMLGVVLGYRDAGAPDGGEVEHVEGWILGQTG